MKMKKLMATLLVATMVCTSFIGCGDDGGNAGDTTGGSSDTSGGANAGSDDENSGQGNTSGEAATVLTWYYPIDATPHHDKAWEVLNAYLEEKINVVIDYKPISWGEYETKTTTIKSSGQNFDIMFQMGVYQQSVETGVTQPITQYLDTVGADMKEAVPESIWKAVTINNEIHGIPTYKDSANVFGLIYNKTLADEAGIQMPDSFELSVQGLDTLFRDAQAKIADLYGENNDVVTIKIMGFNALEQHATDAAVSKIDGAHIFQDMAEGQVFDVFSHPDTLEYYKIMRSWTEDGIILLDGYNVQYDPMKADGTLFAEFVQGYVSFPANGWSTEYETAFIPADINFMTTVGASFGTNIIGASCKNPEAAVAFLNLMNTDTFVANTIRFGIEGEYYNITEDGRLDFEGTLNEDPTARAYYNWYGWQYGNIFAMNVPLQESDTLFEDIMAANEGALAGEHIGFVADTSAIQNELTAVAAVDKEYRENLEQGMLADVEGTVAEMNAKMQAAGIDTIITEMQSQVNAWREENGLAPFVE